VNIHELDRLEKDSIFEFVIRARDLGLLRGRILDYGCGRQPYRQVCEAAGEYFAYDRASFLGNVSREDVGDVIGTGDFDTVLATQVVQYVPDGYRWLRDIRDNILVPGGHLVMTYPTHWPEIRDDQHRYTKLGMEATLRASAFTVVRHDLRLALPFDGFELAVGYGVIGRAG
jgi:SAM-dependent methyltransferase